MTSTLYDIYLDSTGMLVSLKGRLVLEDVSRLKEGILPRIARGMENVYVDLQRVDYVDSAGLGLLIGLKMQSKSLGANIVLMEPNQVVADVLSISRVDGIFTTLRGGEAEAVRKKLATTSNMVSQTPGGVTDADLGGADDPRAFVGADGVFHMGDEEINRNRDQVEEQCRSAVEALRQGDYERSIQCYKAALELDPDYLPALNNLAIVYEKQPNWHSLAVETWERVLEASRARNDSKHMDRAQRHLADLR